MKENGDKPFRDRWAGLYDRLMDSNERMYDESAVEMKDSLNRQMHVLESACGIDFQADRRQRETP